MTESTDKVFILGMTASNTKVSGKMASNTARESTERMAKTGKVSGKTERESNGSTTLSEPI